MHPENEQIPLQNTYIPYPLPAQHTPLQQQYPQMYPMPHPVENNYAIPQAYTSPQQIPPQEMQQMPPQPPPAPPPHEMYPPPQEMHSQPQEMYSPPQDMYPQEMYPPPQEIYPQPTSYSQLPRRQTRRYKTTRQVKLTKGNLILDCPVPTTYLNEVPIKEGKEFTHMRYTAATCDPKDFIQDAYTLRQPMLQRNTELFIVLTMYNEDEVLFARTMHGVMKNMAHLCTRDRSRTWGANSWDKVVVCIVSDGRSKINPRTLSLLALLGVYQEGVAKNVVHGKPVTAHIYEYTTQISVDSKMDIKKAGSKSIVPCQILFCLKEKNQKKINSHRWFFQAFAPILNPNVCVLIDVGTKPGNKSLYHLWKTFDINANVAGACGEIRAMGRTALLNPLVAAQNFEYKMSNILDKPLESVFGYISVLPGAFSAYRYTALQNHLDGTGPLEKYFLGETQHGGDSDIFTANMYLAEDRILCYELVAKKDANWVLHYVSSAHGETDVPDSVAEFISQRRRWLNGVYSLYHWRKVWKSNHSSIRKFMFMFQDFYNTYNLIFSWFSLANFYLTFYILTKALGSDESTGFSPRPFSAETGEILHTVLNYIYIVLIIVQFIIAMGNRPQGSRLAYTGSMVFFALLMIYLMFAAIWITVVGVRAVLENTNGESVFAQAAFRNIVVSLCATYAMYIVSSVMFLDPWHMITSFLQYILLSPSYTNVLNIYAFCNTHDVSWGTKGDTGLATDLGIVQATKDAAGDLAVEIELPVQEKDINAAYIDAQHLLSKKIEPERVRRDPKTKQEDYYRSFRTRLVIAWIISNLALVAVITNTSIQANQDSVYLGIILWSVAGLALIRFVGSTLYLILRIFTG